MNKVLNALTFYGRKPALPAKSRVWYYQFPGEARRKVYKAGRWWYYTGPGMSSRVGCDTLAAAKGDLKFSGARVWSELID